MATGRHLTESGGSIPAFLQSGHGATPGFEQEPKAHQELMVLLEAFLPAEEEEGELEAEFDGAARCAITMLKENCTLKARSQC